MTAQPHAPDPMDGLRLALMQQRSERLRAKASGRTLGVVEGLMAVMLISGILVAISGGTRTSSHVLRLAVGLLLIFEAVFLWWVGRRSAREQLRRLDQQIEAAARQPDAAVIAEAASAARTYVLRQRQ